MKEINNEKMKVILSKLTIKEQELLGLIKHNHKLRILYMIGDSNGITYEDAVISLDNPFLKPLTEALNKLDILEGHWGIMLDKKHVEENKKLGNINNFEYDLLMLIIDYCDKEESIKFLTKYNYETSKENINYLEEFEGIFVSDTEYSFLVYEGYELN